MERKSSRSSGRSTPSSSRSSGRSRVSDFDWINSGSPPSPTRLAERERVLRSSSVSRSPFPPIRWRTTSGYTYNPPSSTYLGPSQTPIIPPRESSYDRRRSISRSSPLTPSTRRSYTQRRSISRSPSPSPVERYRSRSRSPRMRSPPRTFPRMRSPPRTSPRMRSPARTLPRSTSPRMRSPARTRRILESPRMRSPPPK